MRSRSPEFNTLPFTAVSIKVLHDMVSDTAQYEGLTDLYLPAAVSLPATRLAQESSVPCELVGGASQQTWTEFGGRDQENL